MCNRKTFNQSPSILLSSSVTLVYKILAWKWCSQLLQCHCCFCIILGRLSLLLNRVPWQEAHSFIRSQPFLWRSMPAYSKTSFALKLAFLIYIYVSHMYICIYTWQFFLPSGSTPFKFDPSSAGSPLNIWSQTTSISSLNVFSARIIPHMPWLPLACPLASLVLMKISLIKWVNQTSYHTLHLLTLFFFHSSPFHWKLYKIPRIMAWSMLGKIRGIYRLLSSISLRMFLYQNGF